MYAYIYIYIYIYNPHLGLINPLHLIKSQAPGPLIKGDFEIQGSVNKRKTRNTTWSHLGVIFGVILEVILGVISKMPLLINTLRLQLITFGGSRFERKWMIPKMTPKMTQLRSPVSQNVLIKCWPKFSIFLAFLIVN